VSDDKMVGEKVLRTVSRCPVGSPQVLSFSGKTENMLPARALKSEKKKPPWQKEQGPKKKLPCTSTCCPYIGKKTKLPEALGGGKPKNKGDITPEREYEPRFIEMTRTTRHPLARFRGRRPRRSPRRGKKRKPHKRKGKRGVGTEQMRPAKGESSGTSIRGTQTRGSREKGVLQRPLEKRGWYRLDREREQKSTQAATALGGTRSSGCAIWGVTVGWLHCTRGGKTEIVTELKTDELRVDPLKG